MYSDDDGEKMTSQTAETRKTIRVVRIGKRVWGNYIIEKLGIVLVHFIFKNRSKLD